MDEKIKLDLEQNFLCVELLKYFQKGKVLDLGCGEGRDSVFLALNGFNVKSIDSSDNPIHKTNQLAKIHDVNLKLKKSDIRKIKLDEKYDVIICNFVLHFMLLLNLQSEVQ